MTLVLDSTVLSNFALVRRKLHVRQEGLTPHA